MNLYRLLIVYDPIITMDFTKIKQLIGSDLINAGETIKESLSSECFLLNDINEYLLNLKGKQIRPVLALLSAKASGKITDLSLHCAIVSEMIHTATLLHDDVADNSDSRRGSPTVKALFSPASSVLTGDFWLAKALSLVSKSNDMRALIFFANAITELAEGELFQLQKASTLDTTEEDYIIIVTKKTSSLFMAAIGSAVYSSGADELTIERMVQYAYHLGIAFQIRDDIFDYMPDLDTGKKAGSDIREKKITLPLIYALANSPQAERQKMIEFISSTASEDDDLPAKTLDFVRQYNGLALAQNVLDTYIDKAIELLDSAVPDSRYKEELISITHYIGNRDI